MSAVEFNLNSMNGPLEGARGLSSLSGCLPSLRKLYFLFIDYIKEKKSALND